jgi:hypothetical protein
MVINRTAGSERNCPMLVGPMISIPALQKADTELNIDAHIPFEGPKSGTRRIE